MVVVGWALLKENRATLTNLQFDTLKEGAGCKLHWAASFQPGSDSQNIISGSGLFATFFFLFLFHYFLLCLFEIYFHKRPCVYTLQQIEAVIDELLTFVWLQSARYNAKCRNQNGIFIFFTVIAISSNVDLFPIDSQHN